MGHMGLMGLMRIIAHSCGGAIVCFMAQVASAQVAPNKPVQTPESSAKESAKEEERSLDELLGIGGDDGAKAAKESARDRSSNLKRILTEQEAKNTLEAAIQGMRRSGTLLGERDFGTAVQRVQEDVLARLDALISTAEQQQQQQQQANSSSSSSSSSSQQQQQGQRGEKGQRPGETAEQAAERRRREEAQRRAARESQQGQQGKEQRPQGGDGNNPGEMPEQVDPIEGGALSETDSEWGNLPPRTRDMVQQGVREKMSSVYRRWTEAYYRRIAEEAKR
jgi:predicted alpha/beta hydrolase family esterase